MIQKQLILLVEDDEGVARLVREILSPWFDVESVDRMDKGMNRLLTGPKIDLIILDLNLPDGRGIPVLAVFQASHPELPILVVSGGEYQTQQVLLSGAQDYLSKPFRSQSLIDAAIRAIARHRVRSVFEPILKIFDDFKLDLQQEEVRLCTHIIGIHDEP